MWIFCLHILQIFSMTCQLYFCLFKLSLDRILGKMSWLILNVCKEYILGINDRATVFSFFSTRCKCISIYSYDFSLWNCWKGEGLHMLKVSKDWTRYLFFSPFFSILKLLFKSVFIISFQRVLFLQMRLIVNYALTI